MNIVLFNTAQILCCRTQYFVTISDDVTQGFQLLSVSASDLDNGYHGYVTHWMSATDGKFEINPETGLVRVKSALDQSEKSQYNVTVFAKDHGIPAKMAEVPLTIYVDNSNKHTPAFNEFSYYVNIVEGSQLNEAIVQFTAADKDEGDTGEVLYGITKGNDDNNFAIDVTSGVVSLVRNLDYEEKQFYEVEVTAIDRGEPPKSATVILHVTVTDVNDNAPVFQEIPAEVYAAQVIQVDQLVYTFQATDADSSLNGNNRVRYQLIRGNDRYVH